MVKSQFSVSKHLPQSTQSRLKAKKVMFQSQKSHKSKKEKVLDILGTLTSYKPERHAENNSSIRRRASEVLKSIAPEYPSFMKSMLASQVSTGFWLGLPKWFCDMHMPKHNATIMLEDESGQESETKYIAEKVGLSAGWRGFSVAHKLLPGDVLVFQKIKPCKLKVYIFRANGVAEVGSALARMDHDDFCADGVSIVDDTKADEMCSEPTSPDIIPQGTTQRNSLMKSDLDTEPILLDGWENESSDLDATRISGQDEKAISNYLENESSEVIDVVGYLESTAKFKENFEQFSIRVNGLAIDYEFSKQFRAKYYELCCSQKSFLHENLHERHSCKLVAAMISETINIADEIKASKLTTCQKSFPILDKTLKSFEMLGMNVGFLRARVERLAQLAGELQGDADAKMRREDKELELVGIEGQVKRLEARLLELNSARKRLENEIEALETSPEKAELAFQEEASGPW